MRAMTLSRHDRRLWPAVLASVLSIPFAMAADLAPDRADVLYHRYEGDNVTIDGPALLVRKRLGKQFAVSGKYYVDSVTGASVDVVATASPYSEERREAGLGVEFVNGKTRVTAGISNSDENDFTARSASVSKRPSLRTDGENQLIGVQVPDGFAARD